MSFAAPWMLLVAIAGTLGVLSLLRRGQNATKHDVLMYSHLAFAKAVLAGSAWRERVVMALFVGGTALALLALARPAFIVPVVAHDGAVVICIDTSGSMASTDVDPTRAVAALRAADAFIRAVPSGVKIGIVAFSSFAGVVQPLTADHAMAQASLAQVPAPNGATAIGDALQDARQMLAVPGHRAVILVTDGENNRGADPLQVAQELGASHIPVFTVGIGTNSGVIIPGTNQAAGIDEQALQSYASASGGAYARADSAGALREALANLGHMTGMTLHKRDVSLACALLGAFLVVVGALANQLWGRFS